MRPFLRYAALYVAVELAAVVFLIWALGLGWALVTLAATFMAGVVLAASQLRGHASAARRRRSSPESAVADGALVGVGSFLVFLPGPVSTVAGVLMLAPPTRAAMRPLATAVVARGVLRGVRMINLDQFTSPAARGDYVDGDYIDGEVLGEYEQRPTARPRTAIARRVVA